jgi:hypothetical protein
MKLLNVLAIAQTATLNTKKESKKMFAKGICYFEQKIWRRKKVHVYEFVSADKIP